MPRLPSLLLLVALVGGIGASWTHEAHHALEWAEGQTEHTDHADGVQAPCVDGDVHALDCAVCVGFSGSVLEGVTAADLEADPDQQTVALGAVADYRRATAPARGPPAIA